MAGLLTTWSPFREMERFRREIDELFDRFMGDGALAPRLGTSTTSWMPAIESFTEDGKLVIRADLPGIDPRDVEVTVEGNRLTLRGSRKASREQQERDYAYREVSYGSFERAVELPEGVKGDEVKATYKNGVLELTVPIPRELAARKVPVQIEHAQA
jgi:HSP20 family protein